MQMQVHCDCVTEQQKLNGILDEYILLERRNLTKTAHSAKNAFLQTGSEQNSSGKTHHVAVNQSTHRVQGLDEYAVARQTDRQTDRGAGRDNGLLQTK